MTNNPDGLTLKARIDQLIEQAEKKINEAHSTLPKDMHVEAQLNATDHYLATGLREVAERVDWLLAEIMDVRSRLNNLDGDD